VLLDDLDLAVVTPLEHSGVVGVHQARLDVEVLDGLVVSLGIGHIAVHPDVDHQRVDRHDVPPGSVAERDATPRIAGRTDAGRSPA